MEKPRLKIKLDRVIYLSKCWLNGQPLPYSHLKISQDVDRPETMIVLAVPATILEEFGIEGEFEARVTLVPMDEEE